MKNNNRKKTREQINEEILGTGCICIERDVPRQCKNPHVYALYQLPCGHTQEVRHEHIKSGLYKCHNCLREKNEKEAEKRGLIILDNRPRKDDADYKLYLLPCGHKKEMAPYNLSKFSCQECVSIARNEDAHRNWLILLNEEDNSKWTYREYKYIKCGHVQSISMQKVTKDNVPACQECYINKLHKEAADAGALILEMYVEDGSGIPKHKYLLECGCEKVTTSASIRINSFACENHSIYLNKKACLYLLKMTAQDHSWLKMGVSSNLEKRKEDFKLQSKYPIETLELLHFDNLGEATRIEKMWHKEYKEERISSETMKRFLKSGSTECYPLTMLPVLMGRIEQYRRLIGE